MESIFIIFFFFAVKEKSLESNLKVYSKPCVTSKITLFAKIFKDVN